MFDKLKPLTREDFADAFDDMKFRVQTPVNTLGDVAFDILLHKLGQTQSKGINEVTVGGVTFFRNSALIGITPPNGEQTKT